MTTPAGRWTTRRHARRVTCPECGAGPAQPCADRGWPRSTYHADRHDLAITLGAPIVTGTPPRKRRRPRAAR